MRHNKIGRKLNRNSSHRNLMFRNMLNSIIKYEVIKTTLHKAKELSRFLEPIISRSKINNLHNKRLIFSRIRDRSNVVKLFNNIGPKYINCNGGYTRIIKCGYRKGDNAIMAYIGFCKII